MTHRVLHEYPPCDRCGFVAQIVVWDLSTASSEELAAADQDYRAHQRHVTQDMLASTPVDTLRERYDVSPIRKQFGSWAVTEYGLECLTSQYAIEKKRLAESDWERHMADKTWVVLEDFAAALRAARTSNRGPVSPRVRFAIMQRDHFRCRLCGQSADDGVTLEIDHRVPVARGGTSRPDNLWTLCWPCNRGKAAQLLDDAP